MTRRPVRKPPSLGGPASGHQQASASDIGEGSRHAGFSSWRATVALYTSLVAVAMFANSFTSYIPDNRFEFYWSPSTLLARQFSLWNTVGGLGQPGTEFWPTASAILAGLRGLGLSPSAAEHVWHGALLLTAGLGMFALLRLFRDPGDLAPLIAGLLYMFNPFSAVFLLPSGLFISYAVGPWLVYSFVRGVHEAGSWRWPATFALILFAAGAADPPGLVYAALPIVGMAIYFVAISRAVSGWQLARWTIKAAILAIGIEAPAFFQLHFSTAALSARLAQTESPKGVNLFSSWSESLRGLGFWISYFREAGHLVRPQHAAYFTSPIVVLATFVLPCLAVFCIWRSKWAPRLGFGAILLFATALMVGSYPVGGSSPFGRLILAGYERIPGFAGFRNSYKAGTGWAIGITALGAVAVIEAVRRIPARPWQGRLFGMGIIGSLLFTSSFPFWTGQLYPSRSRVTSIPSYWLDAIHWINRQEGTGRVLILPGTFSTQYRWGNPGDDIFDSLMTRPHIVRAGFPLSSPQAADLIDAIDEEVTSGHYQPGTLAPIARRLGISWVLLRNDLNWKSLGVARPADLQPLREDPGLHEAAAFGERGRNVVDSGDISLYATAERRLPPVEVYGIDGASPVRPSGDVAAIVSGAGAAWFGQAVQTALGLGEGIKYSAASKPTDLIDLLNNGSDVILTDSNQRRVQVVTGSSHKSSYLLGASQTLGRSPPDLYGLAGSQTTAWYGDAEAIRAAGSNKGLSNGDPNSRPANAFDSDPTTAWLTGAFANPVGTVIRVDLRQFATLSQAYVADAFQTQPGRYVSKATLRMSNGAVIPLDLSKGSVRVSFPPQSVDWFEVRIDAVQGSGFGPVGFSEVTLPFLDLQEVLQLPDDLAKAADGSPRLRDALAKAPWTIQLARVRSSTSIGAADEESGIHRRFRIVGSHSFTVQGTLHIGAATPPSIVERLTAGGTGPTATLPPTCVDLNVTADSRTMPVRLRGSTADLLSGREVGFETCQPLVLPDGWHRFDTGFYLPVDTAILAGATTVVPATTVNRQATVTVLDRSSTHLRARVNAPHGVILVGGMSFDKNWVATIDGRSIGAGSALDTQNSWALPPTSSRSILDIRYRPQRAYEATMALGLLMIALCLALATRHNRTAPQAPEATWMSGDDQHLSRQPTPPWRGGSVLLLVCVVLIGTALGGLAGFLIASTAAAASLLLPRWVLGGVAGLLLVACAIGTMPFHGSLLSGGTVWHIAFAARAGLVLGLVIVVRVVHDAGTLRPSSPGPRSPPQGRRHTTMGRSEGRLGFLRAGLATRTNTHLLRGSAWLLASVAISAVSGWAFWLIAARLYPSSLVGRASALFTMVLFVNYLTGLGLTIAVARFAAEDSTNSNVVFTWAVVANSMASLLGTIVFLLVVPSRTVAPLWQWGKPAGVGIFFLMVEGASIGALVDVRLMAARRWGWVVARPALFGLPRLPLLWLHGPGQGIWLFVLVAAPPAITGFAALIFLPRLHGPYRLRPFPERHALTRYATVNWLATLGVSGAAFALPVLVAVHVTAAQNATFYIAWSIASVMFLVPVVVGQALLVEAGRGGSDMRDQAHVALAVSVVIMTSALAASAVLSPTLLAIYGTSYRPAAHLLTGLLLAGVPWSVTSICLTEVRARRHSRATIGITAALPIAVLVPAFLLVPTIGMNGAVVAWIIGNAAGAIVSVVFLLRARSSAAIQYEMAAMEPVGADLVQ